MTLEQPLRELRTNYHCGHNHGVKCLWERKEEYLQLVLVFVVFLSFIPAWRWTTSSLV